MTDRTIQQDAPISVIPQPAYRKQIQKLDTAGYQFQVVHSSLKSVSLSLHHLTDYRICIYQVQSWDMVTLHSSRNKSTESSVFIIVSYLRLRFVFDRFVLSGETGFQSHKSTVRKGLVFLFILLCNTETGAIRFHFVYALPHSHYWERKA